MMQNIFLSYKKEDEPIAATLKELLLSFQYNAKLDADKMTGGDNWQIEMRQALKNSDGMVPIYTENALKSQFIPSEVGMARAFKETANGNMFIIPLVISMQVPFFISDLNAVMINSDSIADLTNAAQKIHTAIQQLGSRKKKYPRIFISHRHKDEKIVEALISFLESAFEIKQEDIRCTSVQPYTLPIGSKTSEKLREELSKAEVVLGIIGPDTDESHYVLFELGASWGRDTITFPLLVAGATPKNVPGPLSERHCIALDQPGNCWQLLDELKKATTLVPREDSKTRINREITALVEICSKQM